SEMLPYWSVFWIQAGTFAKVGDSGINLSSCHQAITELRLHKIIPGSEPSGPLQRWNRLGNLIQINIAIAHHGQHGSTVRRNLGRFRDSVQGPLGMAESSFGAGQLNPRENDGGGKSGRLLCVLKTLFFVSELPRTSA